MKQRIQCPPPPKLSGRTGGEALSTGAVALAGAILGSGSPGDAKTAGVSIAFFRE